MQSAARPTKFWGQQAKLLAAAVEAAWDDPEIRACWLAIAREVHVVLNRPVESWDTSPHVSPIATEIGVEPGAVFSRLISLLQEREPSLEHACGSDLGLWILGLTMGIVAPEIGAATPATIARFLPDNPGICTADGKITLPVKAFDDPRMIRWRRQFRDYARALRPERKKGRTSKPVSAEAAKTGGKQPVDPELALRVYPAKLDKLDKMNWQQIARKVLRTPIPSDLKARERLRARIRYLEAVGARLYQKI